MTNVNVGFMIPSSAALSNAMNCNIDPIFNWTVWDRQTVAIRGGRRLICKVREHLRNNHKHQSESYGDGYMMDVFVNLHYDPSDKDPANRWIRIIYCDEDVLSSERITERFPNCYILYMSERSEQNGTPRTGRAIHEIPCR